MVARQYDSVILRSHTALYCLFQYHSHRKHKIQALSNPCFCFHLSSETQLFILPRKPEVPLDLKLTKEEKQH